MSLSQLLIEPLFTLVGTGGRASEELISDSPLQDGTSGRRMRTVISTLFLTFALASAAHAEASTGASPRSQAKFATSGVGTTAALVIDQRVIASRKQNVPQAPPWSPTLPDQIAQIRGTFGLTMAQTAAVLGVSRPTLYSWLKDPSRVPSSDRRERIAQLSGLIARLGLPAGFSVSARYVVSPLSNGHVLLDELRSESIDEEAVSTAVHEAAHLTVRDQTARPGRPSGRVSSAMAAWGMPVLDAPEGLVALRTAFDQLPRKK